MPITSFKGIVPVAPAGDTPPPAGTWSFTDASGVAFQSSGDTAITVRRPGLFAAFGGVPVSEREAERWLDAFEARGGEFLELIDKPVWVFAWHERRREAVVAVDRYRINWVYWQKKGDSLYFASSLRELLALTGDPFQLDEEALYAYLDLLCVPAESSIQRNVQKLAGGSYLRVKDGALDLLPHHRFCYGEKATGSESELAEGVRDRLQAAVEKNLSWISEARFGCFLSGGTDSSSLLGCSSLLKGAGVPAYSVTFTEDSWDELEFAQTAARAFGAKHTVVPFEMQDALRIADLLPGCYHEPMGNPSLLATYKCVESAAADGVEYLIAGDGGDEIFGGNERYAINTTYSQVAGRTPRLLRKALQSGVEMASTLIRHRALARASRILQRVERENPERYYLDDAFAYKIYPHAFLEDFADTVNPRVNLELFQRYYHGVAADEELDRLLFIDMRHTLGDNDLVKVGISGRANRVGILYPMLDNDLVEFACRLPAWAKLKGQQKRYLFKKAMAGLVPQQILYKKKQGFGVPVSEWLRSSPRFIDLYREVVFDRGGLALQVFDERFLSRTLHEHQARLADAGMFLWGLYALNLWYPSTKGWGGSDAC